MRNTVAVKALPVVLSFSPTLFESAYIQRSVARKLEIIKITFSVKIHRTVNLACYLLNLYNV